jgi:hypothetical protein
MDKNDWYFVASVLLSLVGLLGLDWNLIFGRVSVRDPRKRELLVLLSVALALVLSAFGWFRYHSLFERIPYLEYQSTKNLQGAINSWGALQVGSDFRSSFIVDGDALYSFRDDYGVAAVAFHNPTEQDWKDITELVKSNIHDISHGEIAIGWVFPPEYVKAPIKGTQFVAILVPNKVRMDQFTSLRQAESMGVKIVGLAGGPP